jgi:hypothetical protein
VRNKKIPHVARYHIMMVRGGAGSWREGGDKKTPDVVHHHITMVGGGAGKGGGEGGGGTVCNKKTSDVAN